MRKFLTFITALALVFTAACATEEPHGTRMADGAIRAGKDTVWVRDNNTGEWMLFYMMMNANRQAYYQPAPQAITYHHIVTNTASSAPRSSYKPRAVTPQGFKVAPKPSTSSASSYRSNGGSSYKPNTSSRSYTPSYRPSTSTRSYSSPSYRSYSPSYRSYSSPSRSFGRR